MNGRTFMCILDAGVGRWEGNIPTDLDLVELKLRGAYA
jgi:hypothetical protein